MLLKALPFISALLVISSVCSPGLQCLLLVECQLSPWCRTALLLHLLEQKMQEGCDRREEAGSHQSTLLKWF